jgi:hypothetical protein
MVSSVRSALGSRNGLVSDAMEAGTGQGVTGR